MIEKVFHQVYVKRYIGSIEGDMSFIERNPDGSVNEANSLRDVPILTGQQGYEHEDWSVGKSGFPTGTHWLWTKRGTIKQYGDLDATGGEVGRFYHVSSRLDDMLTIVNLHNPKKKRTAMGFHDDNDFWGSAGCVVTPNNDDFRLIVNKLEPLEDVLAIPFTVFKGER